MKGRKKIPDELKSLRGTDQPCRMTGGTVPAGTAIAALPRSGLKGTARKVFEVVATELIHKSVRCRWRGFGRRLCSRNGVVSRYDARNR